MAITVTGTSMTSTGLVSKDLNFTISPILRFYLSRTDTVAHGELSWKTELSKRTH